MSVRKVLLVAAAAVLALSTGPSAWACKYNSCTPGFWKNHVEFFYGSGLICETPECRDAFLAQLMPQLQDKSMSGEDRALQRAHAAAVLNAWADRYYRYNICSD